MGMLVLPCYPVGAVRSASSIARLFAGLDLYSTLGPAQYFIAADTGSTLDDLDDLDGLDYLHDLHDLYDLYRMHDICDRYDLCDLCVLCDLCGVDLCRLDCDESEV